MRRSNTEVQACKALVIDGNTNSRSALVNMLRDIGVGNISQTSRLDDARNELGLKTFDIVLCDYHFEKSAMTGQDLLDDLRELQLLPYATVFVMVTAERSYLKVAEAAESALDSYLLKPHSAGALEERVLHALRRKRVLGYIFDAIRSGDFANAAKLCLKRFAAKQEFWLYAGHVGAELLMRLKDHASASAVYSNVYEAEGLPWAKLGMARAEFESGQAPKAIRILQSLIEDCPAYADAYELMCRIHIEDGDLAAAFETSRDSSRFTPDSIPRLQSQGMLAYLLGQPQEAAQTLERSVRLGAKSKMFDHQTLVVMGLLHFDQLDADELSRVFARMEHAAQSRPGSVRLQWMAAAVGALQRLLSRDVPGCLTQVGKLAQDITHTEFDCESAFNLLAVLARVRRANINFPEADAWVGAVSQRFCVSKASCDMLCIAAGDDAYRSLIQVAHSSISGMAEEAMRHAISGAPAMTVEALLLQGSQTRNARLIELAGAVLNRHAASIDLFDTLNTRVHDLKMRYCQKSAQIKLGKNPLRSTGGLQLRV